MSKAVKVVLVTYLAFGIYYFLDELYFRSFRNFINAFIKIGGVSHLVAYLVSGIPIYLAVIILHGYRKVADSLGISKSFVTGMLVSLFLTLPMFVGYAFFFDFDSAVNADDILIKVIAAAFFEELFFRAFLFGQVFRFTRVGFLPSVLLGALLFAFIHLYQSRELLESAGIFGITFLAGILFAWMYVEWNYNIWIPIFLHLFMNLAALIFSATDNALGGIYFNIFRGVTVLLAIVFTILYKSRKHEPLAVGKGTLWMKAGKRRIYHDSWGDHGYQI